MESRQVLGIDPLHPIPTGLQDEYRLGCDDSNEITGTRHALHNEENPQAQERNLHHQEQVRSNMRTRWRTRYAGLW